MGWLIEGVWTSRDGINWTADMSEITHDGGWGESRIPNTQLTVRDLQWTPSRNRENETMVWEAKLDGQSFTIFND